jgi:hypothetical protein
MATMTKSAPVRKAKKTAPVVTLCLAIDHVCYGVVPITGITDPEIARAWRLDKRSGDGEVYDVHRTVNGLVVCDCPSYETTFKGTADTCKHGKALVAMGLLDAPSWSAPVEAAPVEPPAPIPQHIIDAVVTARPGDRTIRDAIAEATADEVPATDDPDATIPAGSHTVEELAEPIGWPKPAPRFPRLVPAGPRPVRPAPLPDGRYSLVELVEGQSAYFRGMGSPVFDLMADRLDELARDIRATGATSVADFADRLPILEAERLDRLQYDAFNDGFRQAESQALGC